MENFLNFPAPYHTATLLININMALALRWALLPAFCILSVECFTERTKGQRHNVVFGSRRTHSLCASAPAAATVTRASRSLSRGDAAAVIDTVLFPPAERAARMIAAGRAQGIEPGTAIDASDPRTLFTYGEFPLASFDELVDAALEHGDEPSQPMKVVDVGSGCGRLVVYVALSRRGIAAHGIEVGEELHDVAARIQEKGVAEGYFEPPHGDRPDSSTASLHLGTAQDLSAVLEDADVVFAYSSTWRVEQDWNVELSARVLGPEWSEMLAQACRPGCVAITTDRALDPSHGWDLVERRDVANPEMLGSTGFIHLLRK